MAYPEKVTYPDKYNLRPIVDPDGQMSAENANHLKEKINKNALFHGVHDNLAALQSAFANPPVGAFAYLLDGSHYRCVNIGWVTNEGGGGSDYFYGYHLSLAALEQAHPVGVPGARAIIKVTGGNDKEALWDEDDQEWFEFAVESVVSKDYVDTGDANTLQAAKDHAQSLLGGSTNTTPSLHSFHIQHLQNLDYRVYAWWSFPEEGTFGTQQNPVVEDVTLANGDATNDRIDLIALNSDGSISVVEGTPSANPEEPSIDLTTQLRGTIVLVGANATEPTGITETIAYAEGAPEEFTAEAHYPAPPASRINVASTNTPISGTQSVEATNVYIYDAVNLTPDENFNPTDYTTLEFKLKNKISIQAITFRVQVHGIKSNGQAVISYLDPAESYGYSPQDLNVQTISLPFVVSSQMKEVTRIRFVVFADTAHQWGFWLDDVKLLGGNEAPVTSNYVTTEEMEAALAEYADKRLSNIAADLSEAEKTAIKNKLGVVEGGGSSESVIVVSSSRAFSLNDSGNKLLIKDLVTLTWPTGGITDFKCNLDIDEGGQLTIDDQAQTPGDDLDAPEGKILEPGKMAHVYVRPDNGKLRLKGSFIL